MQTWSGVLSCANPLWRTHCWCVTVLQRQTFSRARLWPSTVLFCGALATVFYVSAQPASGVPLVIPPRPEPAATLVYGEAPIPANGGLQIAGSIAVTDATVRVLTPDGQPVTGKLTTYQATTVWTPDRPLSPGVTYDVMLLPMSSSGPSNSYKILVTPARVPARPAVTSMLTVSRFDEKAGLQCCSSPSGVTTDADRMCFASQTASYVAMKIELATTAATPELAQYLFKVGIPVLNQDGAYGPFGSLPLTYNLQFAANEYCFNLEAMDIASGQRFAYADLMPLCQPHGNLGTIGTQPIAIDFAAVLAHAVCPNPPASYVTQWCAINAACSGTPSQAGCEQFGQLCRGEPPPSAGTAAGRAAAGSGGTIKAGSAGAPGMAGGSAAMDMSAAAASGAAISGAGANANGRASSPSHAGATHFTHAKACSAAGGTAGSASGWSGYLAVALLFARRRRVRCQHSVTST
jgi:hypothetical protein